MQINPYCKEIRGGYKKVASSSSSGTHGQKLAELQTAFSALTAEEKIASILKNSNALYQIVNINIGIYSRSTFNLSNEVSEQLQIGTGSYLTNTNGTKADISNTTDSSTFELWIPIV